MGGVWLWLQNHFTIKTSGCIKAYVFYMTSWDDEYRFNYKVHIFFIGFLGITHQKTAYSQRPRSLNRLFARIWNFYTCQGLGINVILPWPWWDCKPLAQPTACPVAVLMRCYFSLSSWLTFESKWIRKRIGFIFYIIHSRVIMHLTNSLFVCVFFSKFTGPSFPLFFLRQDHLVPFDRRVLFAN